MTIGDLTLSFFFYILTLVGSLRYQTHTILGSIYILLFDGTHGKSFFEQKDHYKTFLGKEIDTVAMQNLHRIILVLVKWSAREYEVVIINNITT